MPLADGSCFVDTDTPTERNRFQLAPTVGRARSKNQAFAAEEVDAPVIRLKEDRPRATRLAISGINIGYFLFIARPRAFDVRGAQAGSDAGSGVDRPKKSWLPAARTRTFRARSAPRIPTGFPRANAPHDLVCISPGRVFRSKRVSSPRIDPAPPFPRCIVTARDPGAFEAVHATKFD